MIDIDARMDSQRNIEVFERASNVGDHIEKPFHVVIHNVEGNTPSNRDARKAVRGRKP